MYFNLLAGFTCTLALSACGGATIQQFVPTYANQAFSGAGVQLNHATGAAPAESSVSVFFDASGNPFVTVNGIALSLAAQGGGLYTTSGGQYVMGVGNVVGGNVITPDADYYVIQNRLTAQTDSVYVDGLKTPAAAIAGLPAATYSGGTQFATSGFNWSTGTIDLAINFGTGDVTGTLNGFNTAPTATLTLVPTTLSGTKFDTPLTSSTVNLSSGHINGALYGPVAETVAGTLQVSTQSTHAIGLFGANR